MEGTVDGDDGRAPTISISRASTDSPHFARRNPEYQLFPSRQEHQWHGGDGRRPSKGPRRQGTNDGNPIDFIPRWLHTKKTGPWQYKSSDLKWGLKWSPTCFLNGRVLIIDYLSTIESQNQPSSGKRQMKIAAQEFQHLEGLEAFYCHRSSARETALRVIHVQNATWATPFLLQKFNIDSHDELVGMEGFSKWARYETPRQRNGRPFPNGRSWRAQIDPWRGVVRSAFGLDYLKTYQGTEPRQRSTQTRTLNNQVMHLNAYEDGSSPYGYDVAVQRMSVYLQRNIGTPGDVSPEDGVKNPYQRYNAGLNGSVNENDFESRQSYAQDPVHPADGKKFPVTINDLDNTNCIIIFESSASVLVDDCLIQPRQDLENRWRRLTFYLRKEDVLDDNHMAAHCANLILGDIFHGLAVVWQGFLNAASDHVSILEDKIYDSPADESRAPELWTNSAAWLKVDKIMWIHQDLIREVKSHLRNMEQEDPAAVTEDWLASTDSEFERLAHAVSEDLINPTNNLNDLMYKSVGIRDSRQSLQLGLSMWRLSWITFIFLPLTFIVGFFGMNVDTFAHSPSIAWYFLAAVVLLLLVLFLWYFVKHSLERRRQTAYQRGTYEALFSDLTEEYPTVWSARGAAPDVDPIGLSNKTKWILLKRWFSPEVTVDRKVYNNIEHDADLGTWARLKWLMLKRWLPQIYANRNSGLDAVVELGGNPSTPNHDPQTINRFAKIITPTFVADGEPNAAQPLAVYGLQPLNDPSVRRSGSSEERPSSRGSSAIMVEERNLSDSESEVGEGATMDTPLARPLPPGN